MITDDGDLVIEGTWAGTKHGQLVRQLCTEGHVWNAQLSFQTHKLPDGSVRRELLNGTILGVTDPNAPNGVVVSSKAAVALGAECRPLQAVAKSRKAAGCPSKRPTAAVKARARVRRFFFDQTLTEMA
jgi:hypothetical protein